MHIFFIKYTLKILILTSQKAMNKGIRERRDSPSEVLTWLVAKTNLNITLDLALVLTLTEYIWRISLFCKTQSNIPQTCSQSFSRTDSWVFDQNLLLA